MVYAALFGVGKLILLEPGIGLVLLFLSAACAMALYRDIASRSWNEPDQPEETMQWQREGAAQP